MRHPTPARSSCSFNLCAPDHGEAVAWSAPANCHEAAASEGAATKVLTGIGVAPGHHGEILQGTFANSEGRLIRGLVSLPFPHLQSIAWTVIGEDNEIAVDPPRKSKVAYAVDLMLQRVSGLARRGVAVRVLSSIPEGVGLGSSTADIVAALRSVSAALQTLLSPEQQLAIAVEAEAASDGVMFAGAARMVAQREGRVLEVLPGRLPAMGLISVNSDPERPVDTLDLAPARYDDRELSEFQRLRARLRIAVERRDLAAIARIATVSATINQRHLPQRQFEEIVRLGRNHGALGVQVAHSGRMIGLILPPNLDRIDCRVSELCQRLTELELLPTFYSRL